MKELKTLSKWGHGRGRQADRQSRVKRKKRGRRGKRASCAQGTLLRGAHVAKLKVERRGWGWGQGYVITASVAGQAAARAGTNTLPFCLL